MWLGGKPSGQGVCEGMGAHVRDCRTFCILGPYYGFGRAVGDEAESWPGVGAWRQLCATQRARTDPRVVDNP